MSPKRPYLVRAMYDWLVDNQMTPHLVVDTTNASVEVPQEHVQDGQIILNVHPGAVVNFSMDLEQISFEARFGGVPQRIWVPIAAVMAIYARENGAGTIFEPEPGLDPHSEHDLEFQGEVESRESAELYSVQDDDSGADEPSKSKGKPNLRVVK
ncbi:ClpXP protease specificity-enhancing factor [Aliidiomarina minuta]|nr:ClpXP protease specificity-enhancing factor [Aliidiomarina minuta]